MILAQTIVSRMQSGLDAEGSERYLFDQDFKPAINYGVEWFVMVCNEALGQKKMTAESLRELIKVRVWQANAFSRIAFDPAVMPDKLWSVVAVYPNPQVFPTTTSPTQSNKALSQFMTNTSFVRSNDSCKRLTMEEWNEDEENVFVAGNSILSGSLAEYAYQDFGDYSSGGYNNPGKFEITIRPSVAGKLVAIAYLKYPNQVVLITDQIEIPESMTSVIVERALAWISMKQGDTTSLYSWTEKDVTRLISLLK